ncbi:DUF1851 domain-containing protein [Microbacterium sp. M28]|uniref:T6SS immunity protein Tdi1 domain-containing protein n=1 Tax=Microbacterium sp. M28 TaxID=2962064 RepID=UPI0021F3DDF8|nr:T6SS immunity protein Tdi1 domain-containing protein [Microbacterium sp. M28]UYO98540.1 DUF1851 domain-containing protein [Microbacterium sp. M28]
MIELPDFAALRPVDREVIEAYRDRVPADVIELWETFGYGSFASGFLRVIDPAVYEAELADCIGKTQGDGVSIPIMVTGLADLITWEPSVGFVGVMYRDHRVSGLNSTLSGVLQMLNRARDFYLSRTLNWDIFPQAVAAHGELPYDQSFVFVPLRSIGGPEKVENLKKRETIAAIRMMVELQGVIGH